MHIFEVFSLNDSIIVFSAFEKEAFLYFHNEMASSAHRKELLTHTEKFIHLHYAHTQ